MKDQSCRTEMTEATRSVKRLLSDNLFVICDVGRQAPSAFCSRVLKPGNCTRTPKTIYVYKSILESKIQILLSFKSETKNFSVRSSLDISVLT